MPPERTSPMAALCRLAAPAACVLGLAACSLGPHYERPVTPAPEHWLGTDSASSGDWPAPDWWQAFGSPELDALLAQARRANDDLGAAVARVREADAQRRIAGAALLPTVTATGSATRERAPVNGAGIETYNQFVPLLDVGYEFDFWGKNRAALAAATATARASRYDRQTVELTVLSGVATTYFQALEFADRVRIAESNLATATRIAHGLALEQQAGTATALDVAQQESTVAALAATVPPLRQLRQQAIDALAILLGVTPDRTPPSSGSLEALSAPAVGPGLPSELLARRPDVAEAEAQLVAANADVAVARAAFFPSISLTATGGYESSALATLLRPASRIWSLGGGITQPIFQGGALRGQSEYAKARYAELLADYHKAVISAFSNVEDALAAVRETAEQQDRQQHAADLARRAYRIADRQLHAGTINVLTLLNTQTALFTAEDTLAQVRYARLQASVNLYRALGGGWQLDESAQRASR